MKHSNLLITIVFGLLTFPLFYSQIRSGLDPSWQYFLNKLTVLDDYKFGKNVFFTYGPMGFLDAPMYMNRFISLVIYTGLWGTSLILFNRIIKTGTVSLIFVLVSLLLLFLRTPTYHAEIYIQYCALLSIVLLWKNINDRVAISYFIFVFTLTFFYKFTLFISLLGTVSLFVIVKLFFREYSKLWIFLIPFLIIPLCYVFYEKDYGFFFEYIHSLMEMSKGYVKAMSLGLNDKYIIVILVVLFLYICLVILEMISRHYKNLSCFIIIFPCMFIAYKHGFVRADVHTYWAAYELLVICSVLLLMLDSSSLLADFKNNRSLFRAKMYLLAIFNVAMIIGFYRTLDPYEDLYDRLDRLMSYGRFLSTDSNQNKNNNLQEVPLAFLDKIKNSSFTSYPWELSFIEKDSNLAKSFIPMPVFQSYSACTPYLDNKNAIFFINDKAPEFVILNLKTIDNRIPLLENPATWKSLMSYYSAVIYDEKYQMYLLQRKKGNQQTYDKNLITKKRVIANKNMVIEFNGATEARVLSNLSLYGTLVSLIWKIPEVNVRVKYTDGTSMHGRVVLDNLSSGIMLKSLPSNVSNSLMCVLSDKCEKYIVKSIEFYGDGLQYYDDNLNIDLIYYHDK